MNKLSLKLGSVALLALSFYVEEVNAGAEITFYCPSLSNIKKVGQSCNLKNDGKGVKFTGTSTEDQGKERKIVTLSSDCVQNKNYPDDYHTTTHAWTPGESKISVQCGYKYDKTGNLQPIDLILNGTLQLPDVETAQNCKVHECPPSHYGIKECIKCPISTQQPPR
ncbi:MAG TPA: hypothetical protein VMW10_12950 [Alphaproteobacteria bacterium]|nr:hypothetical protein [Alphaproteobacteria bacterium]